MTTTPPVFVETLISNAVVVTMNPNRDVLADGAVAIDDGVIVAVGHTADLAGRYSPAEHIDGSRFVVVPGLVNGHIHASTEPLTRGLLPDDLPFEENVFQWLSPLAAAGTEEDEHLAAQLGAVDMLASGTTTFLEAATGWYVDAVVEALLETGIRARVGRRIWDRPSVPRKFRQTTEQAIAGLEDMLARHGSHADGQADTANGHADRRVSAWATLVGHTTCSDELWQAAAELAERHGTGLSFHMSPAAADPAGFVEAYGERPFQHLARLGVLGPAAVATHCVHVSDPEVALLAETASHVVHCPTTALKVAYGVTQVGKIPEMVDRGVNVCLGTDGNNAANSSDMYRATYLAAGLFKDARRDPRMIPASKAFEMATLGGARALQLADRIGSVEVGKLADLVLHERDRPEWVPLHNVENQLVYAADGRSVHTVLVQGRKVVEDHRVLTVDTERLFARAERAARDLIERSGLQLKTRWPVR